jgi:hypothetical protein
MAFDMSYAVRNPLDTSMKEPLTKWITEKLKAMMPGDEPDDLLLEYIVTMVNNLKTMTEISDELKDFFNENESRCKQMPG